MGGFPDTAARVGLPARLAVSSVHTRTSSVAPQRSRDCGFLTEPLVGEHRRARVEGDGEHAHPYVFANMPRREAHP